MNGGQSELQDVRIDDQDSTIIVANHGNDALHVFRMSAADEVRRNGWTVVRSVPQFLHTVQTRGSTEIHWSVLERYPRSDFRG